MANTPTREHREAAARAWCGDWAIDSPVNDWVRTGDIHCVPPRVQRELLRTTKALLAAEQRGFDRGRETERAEVVEWLRAEAPVFGQVAKQIKAGKHLAKDGA